MIIFEESAGHMKPKNNDHSWGNCVIISPRKQNYVPVIDSGQWYFFGVEAFNLRRVHPFLQRNQKTVCGSVKFEGKFQ